MDRRDFLTAAAGSVATAAGAAFIGRSAFAAPAAAASDFLVTDKRALKQMAVVVKTAFECVAAGQACVQHCQEELLKGNAKEFAECALAADQMLAICQSVGTLAAHKAKIIADVLDACIKACEACRLACKEHEGHFGHGMHLECKACMEACTACRDACRELRSLL